MRRRTFLKMAGLGSIAFAVGCGSESEKRLYSLVQAPDDMVTGQAVWYASVCRECPAGCGILVKNREGRAIKIEGNPLHPVNGGKLCMRGQAALQGVYHPDRLRTPQVKSGDGWRAISFREAEKILQAEAVRATGKGPDQVRLVSEMVGDTLLALMGEAMQQWQSAPPLVFEPLGYDSLKTANQRVFGRASLASYRMDGADLLVSLGADFLETWLSPVAYARQFKAMHALNNGTKGRFYHASPYQSLTAANADQWLCCRPGSEAMLALGLIRESLAAGKGRHLSEKFRQDLAGTVAGCTQDFVCEHCGMAPAAYTAVLQALAESRRPLVLGSCAAAWGAHSQAVDMAATLLNLIYDPALTRMDFERSHRMAAAAPWADVLEFFNELNRTPASLLLLNQVNPVFSLPAAAGIEAALTRSDTFVVSFSNVMDDTSRLADLVLPVCHSLESWDEYGAVGGLTAMVQPVMAPQTHAPALGDLLLNMAFPDEKPADNYKSYLAGRLRARGVIRDTGQWVRAVRQGGVFGDTTETPASALKPVMDEPAILKCLAAVLISPDTPSDGPLTLIAAPSIRFFDGRGADKPWLCEVPDPLTKVAWQTPVMMHPKTLQALGIGHEDVVKISSESGAVSATVYETEGVHPRTLVMGMGQGHGHFSRYAKEIGVNPVALLSAADTAVMPSAATPVVVAKTGQSEMLAHTDGSRVQHGRKIALSVALDALNLHGENNGHGHTAGLTMNDFPLTLPLAEGYSPERDFYPAHEHADYRWSMIVDLDRCIGCGACSVACYAENNIGVVGEARIKEGREMAWLRVERYHDMQDPNRITFLPMMCQHCDNGPCEAVCPVYAPHHSKEGLNNQIYNRCIGTRFCSQNCPYKVRRFNWFDWKWPDPLPRQLNPDVTVRAKGVMEKCSFCIQRIKAGHGVAKNQNREIRDGEVVPACAQTCPTDALIFGNLMDPESRVRRLATDPRAYQVMGYLNTKPAVIYLKKVMHV